jgi:hypothetical protein
MPQDDKKLSEVLSVIWLIKGKALLMELKGTPGDMANLPFTMQELLDYQDRLIIEKLDMATQPVHLVINMPPTDKHPGAKETTSFKFQSHPRLGHIILVGMGLNPVARFIMTIVSKVRRLHIKTFDTVAEAVAYINRINVKAD